MSRPQQETRKESEVLGVGIGPGDQYSESMYESAKHTAGFVGQNDGRKEKDAHASDGTYHENNANNVDGNKRSGNSGQTDFDGKAGRYGDDNDGGYSNKPTGCAESKVRKHRNYVATGTCLVIVSAIGILLRCTLRPNATTLTTITKILDRRHGDLGGRDGGADAPISALDPPSLHGTSSSNRYLSQDFINLLSLLSTSSPDGGAALQDHSSPQYSAALWLYNDPSRPIYSDFELKTRYVLGILYRTLGGESGDWSDSFGWNSYGTDYCDWFGVKCHSSGDVIGLTMAGNGMTGILPEEIAILNKLDFVNMGNNGLTETIPTELGSLAYLQIVNLGNNELVGTIPTELGDISSLEDLNLRENSLWGTIPTELGDCSSLKALSLYNNKLSDAVPAELGFLSDLEQLELHGNDLNGEVPDEICDLTGNGEGALQDFTADCEELQCPCCTECYYEG